MELGELRQLLQRVPEVGPLVASTERQTSHILADSRIGCQKLGEVVRDDFAKKEWVCECLPNWADEGAGSQGKGVALQVMED